MNTLRYRFFAVGVMVVALAVAGPTLAQNPIPADLEDFALPNNSPPPGPADAPADFFDTFNQDEFANTLAEPPVNEFDFEQFGQPDEFGQPGDFGRGSLPVGPASDTTPAAQESEGSSAVLIWTLIGLVILLGLGAGAFYLRQRGLAQQLKTGSPVSGGNRRSKVK